jgi:DNA-binding transcriptional ArsR family regulator
MTMRDLLAVTKALADENRVRMLLSLQERELCLCQIIELFRLAPSTVSKHMGILHQARLVDRRKEGRWTYYRQAGRDAPAPVRAAIRWVRQAGADDPKVRRDAERLEAILEIDPEVICRKQLKR